MLYVATRFESGGEFTGFVRVAMPLSEVDAQLRRQRGLIALTGLLALVVALFAGALWSVFVTGEASAADPRLSARRGRSRGRGRTACLVDSSDELAASPTSFNRMAEELDDKLRTLTDERDRFEAVLESMDEAVLSLDRDSRIITLNRAARTLLELPESAEGESIL